MSPSQPPSSRPLGRGLVLFPPGTPPAVRRRKLSLAGVIALVGLALIWPVYSLVADPRPLVLGLPFPLVWLILCLVVVFLALVGLYRTDEPPDPEHRP